MLFILVVTGILGSCIYDFNPQVDGEGGYMIVDGDIIIGEVSKIRLSYSWSLVDTAATQDEERMRILYQRNCTLKTAKASVMKICHRRPEALSVISICGRPILRWIIAW